MKTLITTLSVLSIACWTQAKADQSAFDQYKLSNSDIYQARPAPVKLSSYPNADNFKTALTKGAKNGPNFAGHYTIVSVGCGEQCQDNWLIDARDGKIYDRFPSKLGTKYQLDSSMLVVNPPNSNETNSLVTSDVKTVYQVWEDDRFRVVNTVAMSDHVKAKPMSLEKK